MILLIMVLGRLLQSWLALSLFSTWRLCSRDAKRKQVSGNVIDKIGWRKNSPRTSRKRSYLFVCSREQSRQVENRLYPGLT